MDFFKFYHGFNRIGTIFGIFAVTSYFGSCAGCAAGDFEGGLVGVSLGGLGALVSGCCFFEGWRETLVQRDNTSRAEYIEKHGLDKYFD